MAAGGGAAGRSGGGGSRNGDDDDEVDGPFSEAELARRPEVRIINKYALGRAYVRIGLKGIGALALMWATVVLLGGFVTVLKQLDFWLLTFIAFVQAAGLSDAMGDDRFAFFGKWIGSLNNSITSWGEKQQHKDNWFKRQLKIIGLKLIHGLMYVIFYPVAYFAIGGPIICIGLSVSRLTQQDYGSAGGDASKANLKPALNLFYYVSLIHSAIFLLVTLVESLADIYLVDFFSQKHGFSLEVLDSYFHETKRMCVNNPVSAKSWNLITYGAGLLDSELPEDYASGVRVVTMLIEQGIPIRRLLIRSPGRRIRKLIGALFWRSPVEGETRWLAARIVEHIACDLNLAQFPGALECVSSLLDTSYHNNAEQEAHQLPTRRSKARRKTFLSEILQPEGKEGKIQLLIQELWFARTGGSEDSNKPEEHVDSKAARGTNEDLILQGLIILENLAQDQHNCTAIYNTKGLVSKIVAPLSSNSLAEDIDDNALWIQVVDTSLKVVSRLMRAPGETGREMCHQIADTSNIIGNLEAVLGLQSSSCCILELQIRAMEVLAQLLFDGSTSLAAERRKSFIERVLCIFCTVEWMECYSAEETKIKINKETSNQPPKAQEALAKETASRLKEKAGEALAMLSMGSQSNSEAILHAYSQTPRSVQRLTKMLNSRITETESVEAEMDIGCRISAAVILKHLCPHLTATDNDYVKKTTLKKVLVELLHITTDSQAQENMTSKLRWWEHCITFTLHCIENPRDGDQDKRSAAQRHMQQSEERRLQAALLSLCTEVCAKYSIKAPYLATLVEQQVSREDFVGKINKMVEENSRATPACLAILKLTCQMVKELISDDQTSEAMETRKKITDTLSEVVSRLSESSKTMSGVETCMLFGGTDGDCYGVPAKPLLSVLVRQAEQLLQRRKVGLGRNTPAAGGGP